MQQYCSCCQSECYNTALMQTYNSWEGTPRVTSHLFVISTSLVCAKCEKSTDSCYMFSSGFSKCFKIAATQEVLHLNNYTSCENFTISHKHSQHYSIILNITIQAQMHVSLWSSICLYFIYANTPSFFLPQARQAKQIW